MAWWSIVYQAWYSTLDTRGLLLFLSLLEVELADVTCSEDLHQVGSWRQSREKKPIAVIIIIIMVCGKGLVDYLQINLDTPFSLPLHCLIPSITQVHNAHWAIFWIQKVPKIIEIVRNIWNLLKWKIRFIILIKVI